MRNLIVLIAETFSIDFLPCCNFQFDLISWKSQIIRGGKVKIKFSDGLKKKANGDFSPTQWTHFHRVTIRKPLTHTHIRRRLLCFGKFFLLVPILEHKKSTKPYRIHRASRTKSEHCKNTRSPTENYFLLRKYDLTVVNEKCTHTRENEAFCKVARAHKKVYIM